MDERTILVLATLHALLFAAFHGAGWWRLREPASAYWSASNLLSGPGLFAVYHSPYSPLTIIALTLPLLFLWAGIRVFSRQAFTRRELGALVTTTLALMLLIFLLDDAALRLVIVLLVFAVFHALIVYELWSNQRREPLSMQPVLIVVFGVYGLYYWVRVFSAYTAFDGLIALDPGGVLLALVTVKQTIWNLGVMVTTTERLQRRLRLAATHDGLTGILNRSGFIDLAGRQLQRCRQDGRACSLLLMDLDRFKSINDRFGHEAGDVTLRNFATVARQVMRPSDFLARYGGEEFCILLPDATEADAVAAAERLCCCWEATSTSTSAGVVQATVSIGVVEVTAAMVDLLAALKAADQALYAAKMRGRNRAISASDPRTLNSSFA